MREIVSLSMGKDSSALAVYLKNKYPHKKFEFVFVDNGAELPEVYTYLPKLQQVIGEVKVLHSSLEGIILQKGGFLPSKNARYCTADSKIKPLAKYIGIRPVIMYVGLRADEFSPDRGWRWPLNVATEYPFQSEGITKKDVERILTRAGIGLPGFYRFKSRSGCYFCPFQKRIEWVGLLENHPQLFAKAMSFEREGYSWIKGLPLKELAKRKETIKKRYEISTERKELAKCQLCFDFAYS